MKPDDPIRKVAGVFQQTGEIPRGHGKVTGVIAFSLAILCFLGLLAFHFPQYLTTPELRKNYSVDMLRQVMLVAMLIAGGMMLPGECVSPICLFVESRFGRCYVFIRYLFGAARAWRPASVSPCGQGGVA